MTRMPYLLLLPLFLAGGYCLAYESDQYTNRVQPVVDAMPVLDREVNDGLDRILGRRHPPVTERAIVRAVFLEIGGIYWVDRIERWAAKSPSVEKYPQTRRQNIYRGMPFWATRVNFIFGNGRSFRLNKVMVGSDKFGHFFSQGYKYFRREKWGESRERVLAKGWFAERWIFGQLTTGVFSNADLVANYEGWRFYQSLFRDNVTPGKSSILKFENGRYARQRSFTWADHVNDYWDEALNPSYMINSLNKHMRVAIASLCPEYERAPHLYVTPDDAELWERYRGLGLKDNRANRFDVICRP